MRICFICNQIAAWGKIGGFGSATRAIGGGLARLGHDVIAVVPRRAKDGQRAIEHLDGITVYGTSALETLTSGKIFRDLNADIYHSQEPTLPSYLAQQAAPEAVHIVTCRDPRGLADHLVELKHTNFKRRLMFPITWYYEASSKVKRAVRNATAVFCAAPCLQPRIARLYGESVQPIFVPSPIDVPKQSPKKAKEPIALFVGRWDHRKRIERFFELAREFSQMRFVAVGRAHDESYDRKLRADYGNLPNVEMPGFVSRFGEGGLYDLYARAWIIVNTSAREGLPYTFVEAAAWGCAILSCMNPDDFSSRFGYFVEDDDFVAGMRWLLKHDRWSELGQAGAKFVQSTFSEENSIRTHLDLYQKLLTGHSIKRAA